VSLNGDELECPADVLGQPSRDLHPTDVFADGVMGTGLSDEDSVSGNQRIHGQRPFHLRDQIAFEPRKQNREAGQHNVVRRIRCDLEKSLRISHHKCGGLVQPVEGVAELPFLDHHAVGIAVQQVANGLDLRQDQPPLGGFLVNGDDQHGHLARPDDVCEDARVVHEVGRSVVQQRLADIEDPLPGDCRRPDHRDLASGEPFDHRRVRRRLIAFVEDNNHVDLPASQLLDDSFLEITPHRRLGNNHTQIRPVKHLPRLVHAQLAQGSHVINAGRINEEHRPQRQQLHGFLDRIGRGPGEFGDDGHILPRDRVEQAGLANVSASEDADMKPKSFGRRSGHHRGCPSHPSCLALDKYVALSRVDLLDELVRRSPRPIIHLGQYRRDAPLTGLAGCR